MKVTSRDLTGTHSETAFKDLGCHTVVIMWMALGLTLSAHKDLKRIWERVKE